MTTNDSRPIPATVSGRLRIPIQIRDAELRSVLRVVLAVILVLCVQNVIGQETKATLGETQAWLTNKLRFSFEKVSAEAGKLAAASEVIRWDGCTLHLQTKYFSSASATGWLSIDTTWRVPIGKLDTSIAKLEANGSFPSVWNLTIPTRGHEKLVGSTGTVAWEGHEPESQSETMLEWVHLTVEGRDLGDRLLRAITHASSLCGAPKEAF
jgi:hypothetical protein